MVVVFICFKSSEIKYAYIVLFNEEEAKHVK